MFEMKTGINLQVLDMFDRHSWVVREFATPGVAFQLESLHMVRKDE